MTFLQGPFEKQRKTFYNLGILDRSFSRWSVVETESYIFLPMDWRDMYKEKVEKLKKKDFD